MSIIEVKVLESETKPPEILMVQGPHMKGLWEKLFEAIDEKYQVYYDHKDGLIHIEREGKSGG